MLYNDINLIVHQKPVLENFQILISDRLVIRPAPQHFIALKPELFTTMWTLLNTFSTH